MGRRVALWLAEKFWSLYRYEEILRRRCLSVSTFPFASREGYDRNRATKMTIRSSYAWMKTLPRDFTIDQNYLDVDKSPTNEFLASHWSSRVILLKIHEISFAKICRAREFASVRKLQCSAIGKSNNRYCRYCVVVLFIWRYNYLLIMMCAQYIFHGPEYC